LESWEGILTVIHDDEDESDSGRQLGLARETQNPVEDRPVLVTLWLMLIFLEIVTVRRGY